MDPSQTEPRTQLMRADAARLGPPQRFLTPIHGPIVQDSTLGDYYRILKKHKGVIIASVLIVVTLVTVATFRMTPLYEASARIAISKEDSCDSLRLNNQAAESDYSLDYNVELDTQAKIIQSDTLALRVIDDLHLAQEHASGNAAANTATPKSDKSGSA